MDIIESIFCNQKDANPPMPFTQFVLNLTQYTQATNHRHLVVLAGEEAWALDALNCALDGRNTLWLGAMVGQHGIAMAKAHAALGREYHHLVFNSYSGFNPDAFGQSVGTVAGGGLCFLIVPPIDQWPQFEDPDYLRYLASPQQQGQTSANFIERLIRLIGGDNNSHIITQDQPLPSLPIMPAEHFNNGHEYPEQQRAIDQIIKTVTGHRNRPLVITADRGRGKSSALGIAAAQLLQTKLNRVTVTAPSRAALDSLFSHAAQLLVGATVTKFSLQWQGKEILFVAADELVRNLPCCEILLIDEAAAIPTPMLTTLANHYSRLVFATTIHGYEGTGRGFSLRFVKTLASISPDWRSISMSQPIRWASNDPLEQISNSMLGLDFKGVNPDSSLVFSACSLEFSELSQRQLALDEPLLQQVFSLLVGAHYQTKPSDFRQLLDAPLLSILVAKSHGKVIATALVLREGELDKKITEQIWQGTRRLRGHLLAQSLIAQVGLPSAGEFSYARIMRIAVEPSLQQQGIGRQFEQWVTQWATCAGIDFIGASFGATAPLTDYWLSQGYHALRLGLNKDRASGTHALLVLKSLQQNAATNALIEEATEMFSHALRYSVSGEFQQLEQALVVVLLAGVKSKGELSLMDKRNIDNYMTSDRPFEQVDYALAQFIWQQPERLVALSSVQQRLVISKIIQKQPWSEVVRLLGSTGKKQVISELKQAISELWRR